jgi:pyruvate dehydrogenase E2 component (dihydrolipoamide acetyltransferase)
MPFSLTYDHRLIDGAEAARFCRHLAGLLEDPMLLALEG